MDFCQEKEAPSSVEAYWAWGADEDGLGDSDLIRADNYRLRLVWWRLVGLGPFVGSLFFREAREYMMITDIDRIADSDSALLHVVIVTDGQIQMQWRKGMDTDFDVLQDLESSSRDHWKYSLDSEFAIINTYQCDEHDLDFSGLGW